MPYLTLLLLVSAPLLAEWLFSTVIPRLWHRPRWLVLPLLCGVIGWRLPLDVLPMLPTVDLALSTFLGASLGLVVAVFGHFQDRFWRGPSEADVARSGRRSHVGPQHRPRT